MSNMAVDRKALQAISSLSVEVRSYLVDKLDWRDRYFIRNYPKHVLQNEYSPGVDRKALQAIHLMTNVPVKQFLLNKLNWNNYYSSNY